MYFLHLYIVDLIETLWNVKDGGGDIPAVPETDLIETLWNVKAIINLRPVLLRPGFNRDIVECKEDNNVAINTGEERFNRDIVECKDARF